MRLALTVLFVLTATTAAQSPEGSMGTYVPRPVGNVAPFSRYEIGMSGECEPGFVIGRGRVNGAEHEWQDGSWNLGELTVTMPRGAVALVRARDFDGKDAELILRPVQPRELERIR